MEACAVGLDIETADAERIVDVFRDTGWLADGRITAWDDRQTARADDATAAERQRRKRERDKETTSRVTPSHASVTGSHARGEEIRADQTRAEQRKILSSAPENENLHRRLGRYFDERLWPAYPISNKFLPRIPARAKFIELVYAGVDPEEVLAGVQAYAETAPDPNFVKSPASFLADEDWNFGEPTAERKWDANREEALYLPVATAEEREASADTLCRAMFAEDGTRRDKAIFPKDFGKPPVGGWLLAA